LHERLIERRREDVPLQRTQRAPGSAHAVGSPFAISLGHRLEAVAVARRDEAGGRLSPAAQRDGTVQRFPFTATGIARALTIVVQLEGARIVLYSHGVEVGYLQISQQRTDAGTIWELKDIFVHGEGMQGGGLGKLLVYFFALLAASNGAIQLRVLLQNNPALYRDAGFTITPNANPQNPPSVTGVPGTVRDTARGLVDALFRLQDGLPPPSKPAPLPPPGKRLINDNTYGRPDIGDDQL
jgi:hypothetical protein